MIITALTAKAKETFERIYPGYFDLRKKYPTDKPLERLEETFTRGFLAGADFMRQSQKDGVSISDTVYEIEDPT